MRSIRSKVFAAILLTTLTTALAVTLFSYRRSAGMIEEDYTAALGQETARTAETIDRMFLGAYHTHIHAACDPSLREALLAYLAEGDEGRLEGCAEILRTFCRQDASISSLYLLIPEAGVLVTSEDYPVYKKGVPAEDMAPAVRLAESAGGPALLRDAVHHAPDVVSFSEAVEDEAGTARGYLLSNIKERTLYFDYIARLGSGAVREAVLLDRDGRTVTSLGQAGSAAYEAWLSRGGGAGADGDYLYSFEKAPFSQCGLLLIAEKGAVLDALRQTRRDYAVILAVFLLLSLIPAMYLTGAIYRPLGRLTDAIREVSAGDLETRIDIASGDETEVLAREFNQMLGKLEELIGQLLEEEQRKKDAELEALQYQITPHFMYNTLNAIKCSALLKGERELGGTIEDFIELLQACASKKGAFLTVAEDIHILERYIRLQEFRYDGQFSIRYEIAPEARDCLVPRLVLQPLVENALLHGLDMKARDGELTIRAETADGILYLRVQDNGRGMTPEQIDRLLHSEVRKTRGLTAVGVPNVRDRLALYYGDRAGLRYESGETGTAAVIHLPAVPEGER
ncbi:sensor histidine kinase [uncultured Oscillibacter sp.]|uniref:sensor histidine kinase n=1 Tax=uncultured Oscillibacter sp. TaxID=876091 RepID=UPI0025FCF8AD|nr:sensor histidine kinase [uncultured Oscillibacter sp.]